MSGRLMLVEVLQFTIQFPQLIDIIHNEYFIQSKVQVVSTVYDLREGVFLVVIRSGNVRRGVVID